MPLKTAQRRASKVLPPAQKGTTYPPLCTTPVNDALGRLYIKYPHTIGQEYTLWNSPEEYKVPKTKTK